MPLSTLDRRRGHLSGHYGRWGKRWLHPMADSFQRAVGLSLRTTDTGHDWMEYTSAVSALKWMLFGDSAASPYPYMPAGVTVWANARTAMSDVRVTGRMVFGSDGTGNGIGLCYRFAPDQSTGLMFLYAGGGVYNLWQWVGAAYALVAGPIAGPTPAVGDSFTLEVRALANNHTFLVNGTQIGTAVSAVSQLEASHGMWEDHTGKAALNSWRSFRALRYAG